MSLAEPNTDNRTTFVTIPTWILAAGLSPQALALTVYLLQHHNPARGDRCVWPSRARLARLMGFGRVASVDRYLAELVRAGVIRTAPRYRPDGGRTSNLYLLFTPDGPPAAATPPAVPPARQPVQPPLLNPCTPERTPPVRQSAQQEPQPCNYTPRIPAEPAETPPDDPAGGIIAAVNTATPAGPIGRRAGVELRDLIRAALDRGWTVTGLQQHLTRDLAGVRSTAATMRWRLTDGLPAVMPGRARVAAARPPWCGECDEFNRHCQLDERTAYRCPACHPLAAGAA